MNQIEMADAIAEIGDERIKSVSALQLWLYNTPRTTAPVFRAAPSIVTRSEAEMFGLSSPRFAYRTILRGAGPKAEAKGFVNARRLSRFASRVARTHRQALAAQVFKNQAVMTADELKKEIDGVNHCIADSLLFPPDRTAGYRLLDVDLGVACGEEGLPRGVPFLQHFQLGGGMCAQAAAYIVLVLLEKYAVGIHGIAEITALANADVRNGPIAIDDGLSGSRLVRFFRHEKVGLNSRSEFAGPVAFQKGWVPLALESYVLSGFPLIVPVDLGLLRTRKREDGQSLYDAERLPFVADEAAKAESTGGAPPAFEPHAVVVVGCQKNPSLTAFAQAGEAGVAQPPRTGAKKWEEVNAWRGNFIIQDPATFPFLRIGFRHLYDCRMFDPEARPPRQAEFNFVSITPGEVRLPLLTMFADGAGTGSAHFRPGLFFFALQAQMTDSPIPPNGTRLPLYYRRIWSAEGGNAVESNAGRMLSETDVAKAGLEAERSSGPHTQTSASNFRLVDLSLRYVDTIEESLKGTDEFLQAGVLDRLIDDFGKREIVPRWYWIQAWRQPDQMATCEESVWLWDAEREPGSASPYDYLRAVYVKSGGAWSRAYSDPAQADKKVSSPKPVGDEIERPDVASTPSSAKLQPSLVSSYSIDGLLAQPKSLRPYVANFGNRLRGAELYLLMERDVAVLRKELNVNGDEDASAAEFLAALSPDHVERIATRFASLFDGIQMPIVGLASFLPEVSHNLKKETGQAALANLLRIARCLRVTYNQPVRFLELVAGSRFRHMLPLDRAQTKHPKSPQYWISLEREDPTDDPGLTPFLDSVENAVQAVPDAGVVLSIESEPGPYFFVNDFQQILRLAKLIDNRPNLKKILGFNLDVSHYRLSGIQPSWIRSNPSVWQRVVHAHLSGTHRCAHLGDLPPFGERGVNKRHEYEEWLSLLQFLATEPRPADAPTFSGFVSLELEAATDDAFVDHGVTTMAELLGIRS